MDADVFSEPWKNSDIILVADDVEFHVHCNILCMQSPVFEAMLTGEFKEAREDKVNLEDMPDELLGFLKLLYPQKLFDFTINDDNVVAILALADKYQTDAILRICFGAIAINEKNALKILPYAARHNLSVYQKCITVAKTQVSCTVLEKSAAELGNDVFKELLLGKCILQEKAIESARKSLRSFSRKMNTDAHVPSYEMIYALQSALTIKL